MKLGLLSGLLTIPVILLTSPFVQNNYEQLYQQVDSLVRMFKEKQPDERFVLIGRIEGPHTSLLTKALEEALLKQGIERANSREEVEKLRNTYREQGIDVYKNRSFQKLLRAAKRARVTLTLENTCEALQSDEQQAESCILWLKGMLPTTLAFSEHQSYTLIRPKPPSPFGGYRFFLLVLLAYAFVPAFVHRLDIALRHPDGRWKSVFLAPVYLLGNRITIFLVVFSFLFTGPIFWEIWMVPLEGGVQGATQSLLVAGSTAIGLNFLGSFVIALWRDAEHKQGFVGTFAELFVLSPHYWTRHIESRSRQRPAA